MCGGERMRVEAEKVVKGQRVMCDECGEEIFWSDACDPVNTYKDEIEYCTRDNRLYMGTVTTFSCQKDLCLKCKEKRIEQVKEAIKSALLPLGFEEKERDK